VRVLGDGSVLVGGSAEGGGFLAKLDEEGNPATGFGTGGAEVYDLGTAGKPSGLIEELEVLPDGRILAVGVSAAGSGGGQPFVARFTPGGKFDTTFGVEGLFTLNPTDLTDRGKALEVLPDGKLLVAGAAGQKGAEAGDTLLARLTAGGELDPTFGNGGQTIAPASSGVDLALGLAVQADGRAVIAGSADNPSPELLVGRFTADDPVPAAAQPLRCRGRAATLTGTAKADRLTGTPQRDVIVALGGNDKVATAAGDDIVCAGAGKDFVRTGRGKDTVFGQAGPDSAFGGPGRDLLIGGGGVDALFGGPGPDRLVGGPGRRDFCNGGSGRDRRARAGCERRKRLP
jgi:uncharacterized delta-60 repeat protein